MIWILTIEWAGSRWLWSSSTPPAGSGASTFGVLPPPGWSFEAQAAGDPPTPPDGVSVDLAWPGVAILEAAGHRLESAAVELSVLGPGDAWAAREVLLSGLLLGAEYGHSGEPVTVHISPRPWEDAGLFPTATQKVSETTWPSVGGSEGSGYPIVIGTPGVYQRADGTADTCSGSPALPVGSDLLIIAAHRVASSTVSIYSPTDDSSETFSVTYQQDSASQEVAVVDISAAATITSDASYSYFATWASGGLALEDGTPLQEAGDVIAWALRRSSLEVDAGALEAIRAPLAGFRLAGFSDEPVSPWEWLTSQILPLLPVSLIQGLRGIRPVLWRSPSAPLAIDSLSVDRGEVARDGRITRVGTPINDMTLRYAWSARTGQHLRSRRIAGAEGDISSEVARRSLLLLEAKVGAAIESQWVYDLLTADRILLSLLERRQPRRVVTVIGKLTRLHLLRPLDCVLFSEAAIDLQDTPALVRRVEWGSVDARLILEIP